MRETDFLEAVYRIINKYNQKTRTPRQYPTGQLLYSSEVHMIAVIGGYDGITATRLAALLGITKGAVSQTTKKLLEKRLIQKELSPAGNNEVSISLTSAGKAVYERHLFFHQKLLKELAALARKLSPESRETMKKMLQAMDDALDWY